jgi:hypothetical protein
MKQRMSGVAKSDDPRDAVVLNAQETLLPQDPDRYFKWMRVTGSQVIEDFSTPIYD